jgi:Protein of unknown function (DUF3828)
MPTYARRAVLTAVLALAPAAAVAAAQSGPTPDAVVRAFYRYHFAHDMAFTKSAVRLRARWLAPDLVALCDAYFARPSPPDEPPEIDGDPFTDSQEYPYRFRVLPAQSSSDTALVPVALTWPEGEHRRETVVLVRARGVWRIADVRYDSGSSLREELAATP